MLPHAPGIYKITCTVTGKVYVGSSVNVYRRWYSRHLSSLRRGDHYNRYLQKAWKKYGEQHFECCLLETCSVAELLTREQFWIDHCCSDDATYGFNLAEKAGSTLGVPQSALCKKRILECKSKTYVVRTPTGQEQVITNLYQFCQRHSLTHTAMSKVAMGKASHHKGWECRLHSMPRKEWQAKLTASPRRPQKVKNGQVWCGKCCEYKPPESFNRNSQQKDGFAAYCRNCAAAAGMRSYQKHRESRLRRAADYREVNREVIAKKANAYYHRKAHT